MKRFCSALGDRLEQTYWSIQLWRWNRRHPVAIGEDDEPPYGAVEPAIPVGPPPALVAADGILGGGAEQAFHGWTR